MKKEIQQIERRGLPGGPNEIVTYTTGVFSTEGFRMDSPDVNNYQNIIPSGSISMKERDGSPLRKGPIHGVDNLGYEQIMYPGFDYEYPGDVVTETLMAKMGGALLDKTIKCGNCGWEWKAADGGSDLYNCHKCKGGKGLIKAQRGLPKNLTSKDSVNVMGQKHIDLEHLIGYPGGTPNTSASMTGPEGLDVVSNYVKNKGYGSAMNQAQINSWLYNAGFNFDKKEQTINPKKFILGEYYRKNTPYKKEDWDVNWGWAKRKTISDSEADKLYNETVSKLPEQEQLILTNLAKDWFYKNRAGATPNYGVNPDGSLKRDKYGAWSPDYEKIWAPFIINQYEFGNYNGTPKLNSKNEIDYNEYYRNQTLPKSQRKDGGETITPADTTVPSPLVEYVVKKGDTLSKIAAANNTSIRSIMQNNENISDPNVISIDQKINLVNKNVDTPKEEVYKDWNTIRDKKDKINKLSDEQKIVSFYNDKPEDTYLIVDKKNAVMKLYTGGNLTKSFEVGVGQNPGDAQTVTKVKDGKTDWSGGNKSTGAGIYTISNINPASEEYYNEPAFNLKNENGIEVATTIHGTPKPRRIRFNNGTVVDNRMSNGCINGKCEDLKELYGQLDINTKVYILPEDKGNNFQIIDGKPALRVSSQNRQKYNSYVDQKGVTQKGQGANQTTNTLVYKPIKAYIDKTKFKDDVFQWNDFNDEKEYTNTTKPFIAALSTGKKDVMKAAKISSDVYNELAKMSFGIYGTESNFGDTHSAVGNLARATNKFLDPKSSSSPDYKSKATTYGADEETRSVGLTQLRWNFLNKDEKAALKEVGITSNKDFLDPKKAAIGTVTVLGVRYNQQLNDKQKQDVWKYLPSKWNNRSNYGDRVKSNSSYLSFKQLDKKQEGGEKEDTSWTAYLNPANWGTSRYDDAGSFKEAFRAARNEGDSDFLWKGERYSTELKPTVKTKPQGITPELLIRQAYRESKFNPKAISPKGYKGIGQIGDNVIADYKKANNITGDIDPFNIKQNSDVQKYSMNELYNSSFINKPNQSEQVRLAKTLAAYNWGRGNLFDLLGDLKEEGADIYNSLDWINKLPEESRKYVNDILLQKNTIFNNDFSKAIGDQKNKSIKNLYGYRIGGESKPGPLMKAYNRLPAEKKMGGAIVNKKEFGGQLVPNKEIDKKNITMYKDYIKGNIGNDIEVVKNYDKLNRIYYSKAKELGMTTANYIMTYIVGNS